MSFSLHREAAAAAGAAGMERRLWRGMCWTVALAGLTGAVCAPWRVTTGLLLGGGLALLNHHWLRTSIRAAFAETPPTGVRPRVRMARFVLRYFVVATAVGAAYTLDLVSIVATLAGLCAFVVAALVEAARQILLTITQREEN